MKKKNKLNLSFWITLLVGITFSYFIWGLWNKLTDWLGGGWLILIITGGIVLLAILLGYFSFKKVTKQFI